MRKSIPLKEQKILCLQSGNRCAFPGCGELLVEPADETENPVITGEMAHITGESRQGPRGDSELSQEERNSHKNLLLLCGKHHKIVDDRPQVYSVPVLQEMKARHEAAAVASAPRQESKEKQKLETELIHSTILPVTHLPGAVFSGPCAFEDGKEFELRKSLVFPSDRNCLLPILIREKRVFTFYDLSTPNGLFSKVLSDGRIKRHRAIDLWNDSEEKRRYTTLLNRALQIYTRRLGLQYDFKHSRYYFTTGQSGQKRTVRYRPINVKWAKRNVVWRPITKKTGLPKKYWSHLAVRAKFLQIAPMQWCMVLRPERVLTMDGKTLLDSDQIGPKVTRLKARMFNDKYLGEINFWRDFLCQGSPRIILNVVSQAVIIDSNLLQFSVTWPGIPGDNKPFKNISYEEDLFSLAEQDAVMNGDLLDWEEIEGEEGELGER